MLLKLNGWGLRPWMEFEIDPQTGQYTGKQLSVAPTSLQGYAGFGQELKVSGAGLVLCAVYVHERRIHLRIGGDHWLLFEPGIQLHHRDGMFHCELTVDPPGRPPVVYRYRRKDTLLMALDSTYDQLDLDLANLPVALPTMATRSETELVAEWTARLAARPAATSDGASPSPW